MGEVRTETLTLRFHHGTDTLSVPHRPNLTKKEQSMHGDSKVAKDAEAVRDWLRTTADEIEKWLSGDDSAGEFLFNAMHGWYLGPCVSIDLENAWAESRIACMNQRS